MNTRWLRLAKEETQHVISGPAGQLEVVTGEPLSEGANMLALICHPHPQQEGTMHNKIVTTLGRIARQSGLNSVRFNYRGVGESDGAYGEGEGELEDAKAVLTWCLKQRAYDGVVLMGFSFGGCVAARLAAEVCPKMLVTVAPCVHYDVFPDITSIQLPWLVLQGEDDDIVSAQAVAEKLEAPHIEQVHFEGVGHFFHGALSKLRDPLEQFLACHGT